MYLKWVGVLEELVRLTYPMLLRILGVVFPSLYLWVS
jgi:hypothetical protein